MKTITKIKLYFTSTDKKEFIKFLLVNELSIESVARDINASVSYLSAMIYGNRAITNNFYEWLDKNNLLLIEPTEIKVVFKR